jgi:hypothetical protein
MVAAASVSTQQISAPPPSSPPLSAPPSSSRPPAHSTRRIYLTPEQLIRHLHQVFSLEVTLKTLANWRSEGRGPAYTKIGGRARYEVRDIARWEHSLRQDLK